MGATTVAHFYLDRTIDASGWRISFGRYLTGKRSRPFRLHATQQQVSFARLIP